MSLMTINLTAYSAAMSQLLLRNSSQSAKKLPPKASKIATVSHNQFYLHFDDDIILTFISLYLDDDIFI